MILERIIKSISVKMKKNIGHPFITIVMPVRNESKFIQATLMELIEQDYPRNCYEIIVADNGIGLPKKINIYNTSTLGLQLVNNLVNQIDGQIELDRNNGTSFKITFKESIYKDRLNSI